MKMSIYLCLLFFLSCNSPDVQYDNRSQEEKPLEGSDSELPLCKIEMIESCDVESVGATETIYRCGSCAPGEECPECKDHACENCSEKTCRCRHKNKTAQ
jgi:hypothetical protein